ncbi:type II toxin-antitoxin system ParD family antitoxin [Dongia sedimenti]|uniref:Type II toxin-antitoxin system ParD family antitoxin n=1 Tax=Dongia sedimenti TaxID=3064282 RepID=A0ABU0YNF4_9PROT|nr:type II toxin-antitoxin system ParD family antitoxin [Rhodospirillaceae bacterium R-7]
MPTMNVSLPAALAEFVEKEVASGNYSTASEVVRDGLRMLREERAVYEEKLAILKREIQVGLNEVNAGHYSDSTVMEILAEVQAEDEAKR